MSEVVVECDAILFDMDGTLVDSTQLVERMWLRWASEHGIAPDEILAVAHGRPTLDTMMMVAPDLATPEEAARLDALEAEEDDGATAAPGAADLLAALPGQRWAVVTSAVRSLALRRLVGVGLPAPPVLIGADDVAAGKPDPEGYVLAARRLGLNPGRCVVIEDSAPGVQAARAAGARVIGLRTTYPTLDDCDLLVSDLRAVRIASAAPSAPIRLHLVGPPPTRP